ncbi:MAG: HEPN family nuclease, partial [Sedimentisphaerales bacterium]|nr:HEPN family nuclease [Sedimentisphaerales bacterium]
VDHDLTNVDLTELSVKVGHKKDLKGKNKLWLINKIRNGIAHQNIKGINENDRWIGVRLWNNTSASKKDFEIIFTIEELKSLAIALSDKYLAEENT